MQFWDNSHNIGKPKLSIFCNVKESLKIGQIISFQDTFG